MSEATFQREVIEELKALFPGIVIVKQDSGYIQGIPDLLLLFGEQWAALEIKSAGDSRRRPNQEYYVDLMDRMSFAAFIYPENKKDVLRALQHTFKP